MVRKVQFWRNSEIYFYNFRIIYTQYKTLFKNMCKLTEFIVAEKHPSIGKKFAGIGHLFQENGKIYLLIIKYF